MGKGNVGFHQEIAAAAYRARTHLFVTSASTTAAKQLSTVPLYFEKAFVYGYSAVPADGTAPTNNTQNVMLGEKDPVTGGIYCMDPILPGGTAAFEIPNPTGAKLNFQDFWFLPAVGGEGLAIKYH